MERANYIVTANFGPPPSPLKITKFGLLSIFVGNIRQKSSKTPNFGKSAAAQENTQKMDLVNSGGWGSEIGGYDVRNDCARQSQVDYVC